MLRVHSTRLFPKGRGADAYQITGIAARCDWVLLTDQAEPSVHLARQVDTDRPRHIFLSMRSPFIAIRHFADAVLPLLRATFVLVSGSEDATLPTQTDRRWRRYTEAERKAIQTILDSPLLCHWVAENLETTGQAKFSPMPVGMVFRDAPMIREIIDCPQVPATSTRPLQILCAHRTRPGPQWELRTRVTELARTSWTKSCTILDADVPEPEFLELLKHHAFVLCVEGGGLDPSPKAWQAILHGTIPILRQGSLDRAYRQLPAAFVADWTPDALDPAQLQRWLDDLAPQYDDQNSRREVLHRLSLDYWWAQIDGLAPARQ